MHIIGHRGAGAVAPENTKKALLIGMKCSSCVEVDVRMSADGIPVIIHDPTLDRTTDGQGRVSEQTLFSLKQLDAGDGEEIPTLSEVLALTRGRSGLVLEIKEPGSEAVISRLVGKSGFERLFIVSFFPGSIRKLSELLPTVSTGLIYSKEISNPVERALASGAGIILPRFDLVSGELVIQAKAAGLKVFTWTLNTAVDFSAAVAFGVDGFSTDNPCLAKEALTTLFKEYM